MRFVSTTPQISLVIPALNEAPNLPPLLEQIAAALAGREYEVIIVDDNSHDNTKEVAAELARRYPLRLIVRERPTNGLSGAVLHGIAEAKGEYLLVMDADLQHPPAKIPELLAPLERGEADFVVGSRYVPGGSTGEKWGVFRKINSRIATILARPFAGKTTDPMSGFFAMKRSTYERAQRLTPLGYKIALELMCKSRVESVREIPIHFAERTRGESKLTLKEQFRYLEHLSRLYDFTFPRASPISKFSIATISGWIAGIVAYVLVIRYIVHPRSAAAIIIAYAFVIAVVAVFHARYVRTQREFIVRPRPWWDFAVISFWEWLICAATAIWMTRRVDDPSMTELFVISFGSATVMRYVLRKEFLQDVRGLRKELRKEELT
jgi:dolichol-phosphate mannosyltransferase